jgi:hypothetical protein
VRILEEGQMRKLVEENARSCESETVADGALPKIDWDRFFSLQELARWPKRGMLVDDLILEGGFNIIYGDGGTGKSTLALNIGLPVASGEGECFGRIAMTSPVVYLAGEGRDFIAERAEAHHIYHKKQWPQDAPANFRLYAQPVNVLYRDQVNRFIDLIRSETEYFNAKPTVFIDTLASCFAGGDENSSGDMTNFVNNTEMLMRNLDATLIVIHHSTKDGKTMRGHSSLRDAADLVLKLTNRGSYLCLTVDKGRGKKFDEMRFKRVEVADSYLLVPTNQPMGLTATANTGTGAETLKGGLWSDKVKVLNALSLSGQEGQGGLRKGELMKLTGIDADSMQKVLSELNKMDRFISDDGSPETSRNRRFFINENGRQVLATTPDAAAYTGTDARELTHMVQHSQPGLVASRPT